MTSEFSKGNVIAQFVNSAKNRLCGNLSIYSLAWNALQVVDGEN